MLRYRRQVCPMLLHIIHYAVKTTMLYRLAVNNDWLLEEGWALYLQGSHFVRCGVEGLGSELQRRGISRQSQWGAQGIAYVILHFPVVALQD
jgi:hypothetical protein